MSLLRRSDQSGQSGSCEESSGRDDDDALSQWIANDPRLQRMSAAAADADAEGDFEDDLDHRDVGSNDPACSVTITAGWDIERYLRHRR